MSITVHPFFVETRQQVRCGYIVANPESRTCALIDAPLSTVDAGCSLTAVADQMLSWVFAHDFVVRWVIETHPQEQGSTATAYLQGKLLCAQTAAAASIVSPGHFDRQLNHGDSLCLGHTCARVFTREELPGEIALQFDNKLFVSGLSAIEPWLEIQRFGNCPATRVFVARLTGSKDMVPAYCSGVEPAAAYGRSA